jgi:hypothetical protein
MINHQKSASVTDAEVTISGATASISIGTLSDRTRGSAPSLIDDVNSTISSITKIGEKQVHKSSNRAFAKIAYHKFKENFKSSFKDNLERRNDVWME